MKRSERWRLLSLILAVLGMGCALMSIDDRRWALASGLLMFATFITGEIYRYWVRHQ